MLIEMHCHTAEYSPCSSVMAVDLIRSVFAKGLQGLVLTDHHFLWPRDELVEVRRRAEVPDHFLIMAGQEVATTDRGDVLVYAADQTLAQGTALAEIRERFPAAALVWAHPYRYQRIPAEADLLLPLLDGIEIFNSNQTVRENSRGLQDWHKYRFTALGGTDTHGESYAGTYPTLFDHPIRTIADLAVEIRAGRCRPFLKEIPRSGANALVTEVTIGTKGADEVRERIIIRNIDTRTKWVSAERAFHIMEAISAHGFDSGPYRIPKPIDEDHASMTLIEQGVRGKTLFDKLLVAAPDDGATYLRLVACWLARLHNCRLRITPPEEFLAKERQRLDHYLERFSAISHRQTRKAREIMEAVWDGEERLVHGHPDSLVQGHGDFHPKNVIVGQDMVDNRDTVYVAAIDFEGSFCMPRAFDVGCFLAQFRNQFFANREILERYPEELFLNAYLEAAVDHDPLFRRLVELFRARTNLSIAAYFIKLGMGGGEELWRVLVEAEQALAGA